jgi:long-chain fatty acid transport protein
MKKLFTAFATVCLIAEMAIAGGIVTNTNQSASFIRNPARDASLNLDAVYFNPAGLVFLEDGFHLSLNNQTILQKRTITSTFPGMNNDEFIGTVSAPIFPSVYAVYKKNRLALSLGVNPIGGGGSAFFEDGLPSFEQMVVMANLPATLTAAGIPTTAYGTDTEFDGKSLIWGIQSNFSYAITDNFSASLGLRYLSAKNSYKGYLNILINPNQPAFGAQYNGTNMVSAPGFFTDASNTFTAWNVGATSYVAGLQPIIDGGGGSVLLSNGTSVGLTTDQIGQIQGLIMAAGQNPAGVDIATAQGILNAAAPVFAATSTLMAGYAIATGDMSVDAAQTSSGFAPVVGFTYNNKRNFVLAVKYEHKASMTLINDTKVDDVGLYPDGVETPNDMPANLTLGLAFKPLEKLTLSAGYHLYFDTNANYGKKIGGTLVENKEVIDKNLWEAAFGVEYELTEKLMVSAGYLMTKTGVNYDYQSDFSHSLSTSSIGLGGRYMVNENIGINAGFMNTFYKGYIKAFTTYEEEYNRSAMVVALGVDFKF